MTFQWAATYDSCMKKRKVIFLQGFLGFGKVWIRHHGQVPRIQTTPAL